MRFVFDLLIYAFTIFLVLDVTVNENEIAMYVLMGAMFVKEIYIYFACVRRARAKIKKEALDKSMKSGIQSLLAKSLVGVPMKK